MKIVIFGLPPAEVRLLRCRCCSCRHWLYVIGLRCQVLHVKCAKLVCWLDRQVERNQRWRHVAGRRIITASLTCSEVKHTHRRVRPSIPHKPVPDYMGDAQRVLLHGGHGSASPVYAVAGNLQRRGFAANSCRYVAVWHNTIERAHGRVAET